VCDKWIIHVVVVAIVTSIGNHAFNGCTGLTSMKFTGNLPSINEDAVNGCTALRMIWKG
jgi:hypothetical protein